MMCVCVCVNHLPIRPYERNLFNADNARLVIWPVVSSERMTSRNGARKICGSIKRKSSILINRFLSSLNCFINPSCSSSYDKINQMKQMYSEDFHFQFIFIVYEIDNIVCQLIIIKQSIRKLWRKNQQILIYT